MANEIDLQKVFSILDGKAAEIKRLDENLIIETTGVAMALAALRESLDKMEVHLDNREPEKASHVGYQDVAHNFVYIQRTLAGLQTAAHHKEAFICNIAHEASVAYDDVATQNRTHSLKYLKGGVSQNESRKTENIYG